MKFWQKESKSRSTERRHFITIERIRTENENGYTVEKKDTSQYVWASVETLSEKQRLDYQNISVAATHRIVVNGYVDVNESDVIKFNNREFEILTIRDVDERGIDKMIITKEIRPK